MIIAFFAAISALVMVLWNWLMPEIFGAPTITFWQAAGIFLLSKLLFGLGKGHRHGGQGPPWKRHWQQKWQNMPEEQRQKWKQKFTNKWCNPDESVENTPPVQDPKPHEES